MLNVSSVYVEYVGSGVKTRVTNNCLGLQCTWFPWTHGNLHMAISNTLIEMVSLTCYFESVIILDSTQLSDPKTSGPILIPDSIASHYSLTCRFGPQTITSLSK